MKTQIALIKRSTSITPDVAQLTFKAKIMLVLSEPTRISTQNERALNLVKVTSALNREFFENQNRCQLCTSHLT